MARTAAAIQIMGATSSNQYAAQNESRFAYKHAKAITETGSEMTAKKSAVDIAPRPVLGADAIMEMNNYE